MMTQGQYMLIHPNGAIAYIRVMFDGVRVDVITDIKEPRPLPKRRLSKNPCGATIVFWPDDEACDAVCIRKLGHKGNHEDEILGEWEDES